jgi:hypothetical protein
MRKRGLKNVIPMLCRTTLMAITNQGKVMPKINNDQSSPTNFLRSNKTHPNNSSNPNGDKGNKYLIKNKASNKKYKHSETNYFQLNKN